MLPFEECESKSDASVLLGKWNPVYPPPTNDKFDEFMALLVKNILPGRIIAHSYTYEEAVAHYYHKMGGNRLFPYVVICGGMGHMYLYTQDLSTACRCVKITVAGWSCIATSCDQAHMDRIKTEVIKQDLFDMSFDVRIKDATGRYVTINASDLFDRGMKLVTVNGNIVLVPITGDMDDDHCTNVL